MDFQALTAERKQQLRRIADTRGHDVLVIAADLSKNVPGINTGLCYADIERVRDQLANLSGEGIDVILETPGGSGEVAEDVVHLIRGRFSALGVIVPGWAKSAGTIMAMAADEILMDPTSAFGPIDAQITWQGKVFSAEALIQGLESIKREVEESGVLNKAYIPMLQGISPGELQHARNALDFGKKLVTNWLAEYKFRNWEIHASTGQPVTADERRRRAKEIAAELCNHSRWLSHGRSIKMQDLKAMGLRITDYSQSPELADAIGRYHTLLRMTFSYTNAYKVFETPVSQLLDFLAPPMPAAPGLPGQLSPDMVVANVQCHNCNTVSRVQFNLGKKQPVQAGNHPFPPDGKFRCPSCGTEHDLSGAKQQVEAQTKKRVVV
ncbi:MAG: Clp protease ClpP [Armatimonadetes bacterium]|nr:Clp protease ClpP [Armatimonadota bacterium]